MQTQTLMSGRAQCWLLAHSNTDSRVGCPFEDDNVVYGQCSHTFLLPFAPEVRIYRVLTIRRIMKAEVFSTLKRIQQYGRAKKSAKAPYHERLMQTSPPQRVHRPDPPLQLRKTSFGKGNEY